jgi:AraC family transcriptional regulator of adaptative response / DNA-3-methyladenine glycosylase II
MPHITLDDHDLYDRARQSRDARFDGVFFTAVRSTGIYCRPVCPAPPPKRSNVRYYPSAAAAAAAGYRPCLRCRPELSPEAQQHLGEESVQRALALIAEGALQDASVERLAADVGLSARQLQRVFVAQLGATPAAVHATRRLLLAKQLLTETALPITQVALAAGFNSLRRFNTAFLEGCGMPPSAIRKQRAEVPGGDLLLRLGYRPPLDFAAMLDFLRKRAIPGIERVGETSYARVLGPLQASTRIQVEADPQRHELRLRIAAADPRAIPDIVRRVRRIFDLDADLRAVHATLGAEPLLARAIARRPGLRVPGGWDGFDLYGAMFSYVVGPNIFKYGGYAAVGHREDISRNRDDTVASGLGDDVVYVSGGDEVFAIGGDDKIIATYPADDMYIDCGDGEDKVIFNEDPSDDVFFIDCETVEVKSAGCRRDGGRNPSASAGLPL